MSLNDWITPAAEPAVLTRELLERTMEQIRNAPTHPCRLGRHVVPETALREGWAYARCGNCGGIVPVAPT